MGCIVSEADVQVTGDVCAFFYVRAMGVNCLGLV